MIHIEQKAQKIIRELELNIPISVESVAKKYSVEINKVNDKTISVSGLLYRKEGVAYMAINSAETPERQRFTIAHEIGHFLLHESKDIFVEYRPKTYEKKGVLKNTKEIEANHFAASLLMPREELENDVKNLNDLISENDIHFLSSKYQVSEEAMTFRLLNLNLFKQK